MTRADRMAGGPGAPEGRGAAWTDERGTSEEGRRRLWAPRRLAESTALFAYGTLQFAEVLAVLLDRVPARTPGAVAGWRAAALAGRVYPGLVRADGEVTGMLLTGLTLAELRLIDSYESGPYELELLTLNDGRVGWGYAWTDQAEVLPHDWSPGEFADVHLADFADKCRAWREGYEAAGRTGRGIRRPHDPGPAPDDHSCRLGRASGLGSIHDQDHIPHRTPPVIRQGAPPGPSC